MKLNQEQKAFIKSLDKSKNRKEQKREFKLQNSFEFVKKNSIHTISILENKEVDIIRDLCIDYPTNEQLGRVVREMFKP